MDQVHSKETEARQDRLEQLERLQVNSYPHCFNRSNTLQQVRAPYRPADQEGVPAEIQVAGRVMVVRDLGGLFFGDLVDQDERMQFMATSSLLGEASYTTWMVWC